MFLKIFNFFPRLTHTFERETQRVVHALAISAENCARMAQEGTYGTDHRALTGVRVPGRTELTYSLNGLEALEDGNVWCKGETIVHNGQRIDRAVRTVKLALVVSNEAFVVDEQTQEIYAEGAQEALACQAESTVRGMPKQLPSAGAASTQWAVNVAARYDATAPQPSRDTTRALALQAFGPPSY